MLQLLAERRTRRPTISGTCMSALAPTLPMGLPSIFTRRMVVFSMSPTLMLKHAVGSKLLLLTSRYFRVLFSISACPRR